MNKTPEVKLIEALNKLLAAVEKKQCVKHTHLRHPLCGDCQLDARREETEDALEFYFATR